MPDLDPEKTTNPLLGQSPEAVAGHLIEYLAQTDVNPVAGRRLVHIAGAVGSDAVSRYLLEKQIEGTVSVEYDQNLQIKELHVLPEPVEKAAKLAVKSAAQLAPVSESESGTASVSLTDHEKPTVLSEAPEPTVDEDPPLVPADKTDAPVEPILPAKKQTAAQAIVELLQNLPEQTMLKGGARSAGSRIVDVLTVQGHTRAGVTVALGRLIRNGIINAEKPSEKAKIYTSISLNGQHEKSEATEVASETAPIPASSQNLEVSIETQHIATPEREQLTKQQQAEHIETATATLEERLEGITGRAAKAYVTALYNNDGEFRVGADGTPIIDLAKSLTNACIPEGDTLFEDEDIVKVQRKLLGEGVIAREQEPNGDSFRISALKFSSRPTPKDVKKKI